MRGVIKFKDSLVYANAALSGYSLPQNDASHALFECYSGGSSSSLTNGDIVAHSENLWQSDFSKTAGDVPDGSLFNVEVSSGQTCKPVFLSLDLQTPLGFSSFLANSLNHRKVFIPSTFNMSKIVKSVRAQQSVDLVCDKDFYEAQLPGPVATEYKEMCSSVQNVIVAAEDGNVGSSELFGQAAKKVVNPYRC